MVEYNFYTFELLSSLTTFTSFLTHLTTVIIYYIYISLFFHLYSAFSLHITSVSVQSSATSVALHTHSTDLKFTIPKRNDTKVIQTTSCLITQSIELHTLTNDQVNPVPNQQFITKL